MTDRRCAFIDIGTNTILCLIVECGDHGDFHVLDDLAEIPRLGQDVDQTRRISEAGERRSAEVLRDYSEKCARLNVDRVEAVGTSALRDAENSPEVRERWRRSLGLEVRVLSGEQEAACSFLAARDGLKLQGRDMLVIDIGGGSTELIRGGDAGVSGALSIDIGSVRLTERFLHSDPVTVSEVAAMADAVDRSLAPLEAFWRNTSPDLTLVGIAGTFTTLAAVEKKIGSYSHSAVHGSVLLLDEVYRQQELYRGLTVARRKALPGLDPRRADVIFAGAFLVGKIMELFRARRVIVSDQGVRYGLLYKYLRRANSY